MERPLAGLRRHEKTYSRLVQRNPKVYTDRYTWVVNLFVPTPSSALVHHSSETKDPKPNRPWKKIHETYVTLGVTEFEVGSIKPLVNLYE